MKKDNKKVEETQVAKLEMNSSLNVSITKDDLFLVMQQEKISKLSLEIEVLEKEQEIQKKKVEENKEKVLKEVLKLNKLSSDVILTGLFKESGTQVKVFDLESRIVSGKSPKTRCFYRYKYSLEKGELMAGKDVKVDGFEGRLCKRVDIKIASTTVTKLLKELNECISIYYDLAIEKNKLEYQRLDVDTNKKFKADFIKQFISNNPEITKLIS